MIWDAATFKIVLDVESGCDRRERGETFFDLKFCAQTFDIICPEDKHISWADISTDNGTEWFGRIRLRRLLK